VLTPVAVAADDDSVTVDGEVNPQVTTVPAAATGGYVSELSAEVEVSSTSAAASPEKRQLVVAIEMTSSSTTSEHQQETSDAQDWTTSETKAPSVVDSLNLEPTSSTMVNRPSAIDDGSSDDSIPSTSAASRPLSATSEDATGKDRMP
jgi:hypothetical protein